MQKIIKAFEKAKKELKQTGLSKHFDRYILPQIKLIKVDPQTKTIILSVPNEYAKAVLLKDYVNQLTEALFQQTKYNYQFVLKVNSYKEDSNDSFEQGKSTGKKSGQQFLFSKANASILTNFITFINQKKNHVFYVYGETGMGKSLLLPFAKIVRNRKIGFKVGLVAFSNVLRQKPLADAERSFLC